MILGWNLLLILLRLLNRLLSRLLIPFRGLDHPTRARPGVEDFFSHRLGLLHLFRDRGRRKREQALFGDYILRAINRNVRNLALLIHPAVTRKFLLRLLAKSRHRFERELGGLIIFSRRALQHRFWRQPAARLDLGRGFSLT